MKRISLLIGLVLGIIAISPAQDRIDFDAVAARINAACPISTGPGLTFTSIEEKPESIVLNYEINEQTMSVDAMQAQAEMLHDVYASELLSSTDPNKRAVRSYVLSSGKPLTFHFTGPITDDTFTITIRPGELK